MPTWHCIGCQSECRGSKAKCWKCGKQKQKLNASHGVVVVDIDDLEDGEVIEDNETVQDLCDNCLKRGHLAHACTLAKLCKSCGGYKSEHKAVDCPHANTKCEYCGRVGHIQTRCKRQASAATTSVALLRQCSGKLMAVATLPWKAELELGMVNESIGDVPKGQIHDLPQLSCSLSQIVVADTIQKATEGVRLLRKEVEAGRCFCGQDSAGRQVVSMGFDTETKPKFTKGPANAVSLVQLASVSRVVLFRVCCFDLRQCPELLALLSDRTVLKIGVGASADDMRAIRSRVPAFADNGSFVDCAEWLQARFPGLKRPGLRGAAATLLAIRVSKAQQMKNWAMKPALTPAMVQYAAGDAAVSLGLARVVCGVDNDKHSDSFQTLLTGMSDASIQKQFEGIVEGFESTSHKRRGGAPLAREGRGKKQRKGGGC
jgi:hypothetical protein